MDREIKFRAKRVDNGDWAYGGVIVCDDYCIIDQGHEVYVEEEYKYNGDTHCFSVAGVMCDEKTIGQFTGLYDKNNKPIYDGDILGNGERVIGLVKGGVRGYCYDVIYKNHPAGEKRWSLYGTVEHDFPNKIEVIGNIYDDSKLMEE